MGGFNHWNMGLDFPLERGIETKNAYASYEIPYWVSV